MKNILSYTLNHFSNRKYPQRIHTQQIDNNILPIENLVLINFDIYISQNMYNMQEYIFEVLM